MQIAIDKWRLFDRNYQKTASFFEINRKTLNLNFDFDESDIEIVLRGEEGAELSESEGDDDSELDKSAPSGESETGEVK